MEERGSNNNNSNSSLQKTSSVSMQSEINSSSSSSFGLLYQRQRSRSVQPELISLSNMPRELGMSKKQQKSISFSGVSYVIDSLLRTSTCLTNKNKDVEAAVQTSNMAKVTSLCFNDLASMGVAALSAVQHSNLEVLMCILDLADDEEKRHTLYEDSLLLHVAAELGNTETCGLLLNRGFSATQFNLDLTETPMHCAARGGHIDTLELLHTQGGGDLNATCDSAQWSVLHAAVKANQSVVVKYLLDRKVSNVNRVKFTSTPLHVAAENNFADCAELLLRDNVLVDALRGEKERETPLHLAAAQGYCETSKLLLKYNADPNARNGSGETPLHLASKVLSSGLMQILIDKGSDVDAQDNDGRPPLHCAINSKQKGGSECMRLLLDRSAQINLPDNTGMTALHLAAVNAKLSRVNLLIMAGADLCAKNSAGKSALQFAMKHVPNCIRAIERRMDAGLKVTNPDSEIGCEVKMEFATFLPATPTANFQSEVGVFDEMLRISRTDSAPVERLLLHPLAQGYLHLKWSQIKSLYYAIIVFSHLIYSITYSVYSVAVFRYLCPPTTSPPTSIGINTVVPCSSDLRHTVVGQLALTSWILLILFTMVYVAKEATKAVHIKLAYIREYESWLNVVIIVSFTLVSFHVNPLGTNGEKVGVAGWQYHANGCGVFATWLLQMFHIGKVPRFGKYVEVFKKVSWTFVNFLLAYIFLFVAFALGFVVLFPNNAAFEEPYPAVLVKVLVMMLGELEYDDLYYPERLVLRFNNNTGRDELHSEVTPQLFPFTAHILVTIFIVFVSIIIMNLLFGLAVADIQELYKVARLHQLIQQVQLISYMEKFIFSPMFQYLPNCLQKLIRKPLQGLRGSGRYQYIKTFSPNDFKDKSLSSGLAKIIYARALELHEQRSEATTLEQKVDSMRHQICDIYTLLLTLTSGNIPSKKVEPVLRQVSLDEDLDKNTFTPDPSIAKAEEARQKEMKRFDSCVSMGSSNLALIKEEVDSNATTSEVESDDNDILGFKNV